jgi:hypothetical protein
MYSSSIFSKNLRNFKLNSPVVFTFHINWKIFENFGLENFAQVKTHLKQRSIQNVEFLPILTDKKSDLTTRLRQFKRGIEKIVDKYDEKVHVIGYSYAGIIPKIFISEFGGENFISSLLTISTPHTSCRYVDLVSDRIDDPRFFLAEPAFRAAGVSWDWLRAEYNTHSLSSYSSRLNADVKYQSVGGMKVPIRCSEVLRVSCEDIMDDSSKSYKNDGLIWVDEAKHGKHLINFDADHFELIGMRPNFDASMMFDLYAQAVKSCGIKYFQNDENSNDKNSEFSQFDRDNHSEEINLKY